MSETDVAFARSCPRGVETVIAFARAGSAPTETDIAFAGEKWAFFVRFSVAEASSVSTLAVHGRAVVMAVSRWPASAAAVVAVVASSPRCCAQCAIKFAHRAENTPKLVFLGLLGELCRGAGRKEPCRASSVAPPVTHAHCRATFISDRTGNRLAGPVTSGSA